ncbi:ArsR/SmtB family transcription factor [Lachnospiraceae bacterium LCP25S3_G4]
MATNYCEDVKLIKALADENRLAILELLLSGEKCGCVLLDELSIMQPTLSHHMKILCDAGIVKGCKQGKWIHYSICENGSNALRTMISKYSLTPEQAKEYKKCNSQESCK